MKKLILAAFCVLTTLCTIVLYQSSDAHQSPYKENKVWASPLKTVINKNNHLAIPTEFCHFGLDLLDVKIDTLVIKKNQTFSVIAASQGISDNDIHEIVKKSRKVFNVKKLVRGKKILAISEQNFDETNNNYNVSALIYLHSPYHFVTFNIKDLNVWKGSMPIERKTKEVYGVISHSLFMSLQNPELTNNIVDIFAWQVDFQHLIKGDEYKIVYEEVNVNDRYVGIGKIHSAWFKHANKEMYAFSYIQGNKLGYYNQQGKSLRKAFLRYPIKFTRISSRFTRARYHPVQKRWKAHKGTDFAAPIGTPIRAVGDGIITISTYNKYNGNYVKIKHNATYSTQYLHMLKRAKGIVSGKRVKQGQVIGYVGKSGLATGPHLCYRLWRYGKQIDALKVNLPSEKSISKDIMDEFTISMKQQQKTLDSITIKGQAIDSASL